MVAGNRVLIVGGSSGIGFATAKLFVQRGAETTVASHDPAKLDEAVRRIGQGARARQLDIMNDESIVDFFASEGAFSHIVVTAAATETGSIRDLPLKAAYKSMDSKFWGAYRVARSAMFSKEGSLTLVSGFLSHRPDANSVLQGAIINSAIEGLVRGLALEFAPVRVNAVSPGIVDTTLYHKLPKAERDQMLRRAADRLPVRRVGEADDVAAAILLLATNPFATGSVLTLDGGGTIA
jgi:NAD(P)-dependent dehydrogenase (short-subunit alcohol dehydrogenase family)